MSPYKSSQRPALTPENALARAMAWCAHQERSTGEVLDKLRSWGVASGTSRRIVSRLEAEQYVDDRRYAHAYCHDKFQFNGWGRVKIRLMLRTKGIDGELIAEALDDINSDEYRDKARRLLAAKQSALHGREPRTLRASLARFAASRGFEPDVFFPIIDQLTEGQGDENED